MTKDSVTSVDSTTLFSGTPSKPTADNLLPENRTEAATTPLEETDTAMETVPDHSSSPIFQARNAKIGTPYHSPIETDGFSFSRITRVRLPSELGLKFDVATQSLSGNPAVAGDHRLTVCWLDKSGIAHDSPLILTVIPDPKSLWKDLPPPENALYFKENEATQLITMPSFSIIAASRRGRSHAHTGSFRDDDFFIHASITSGWSVMVVSDGAGSAPYAREGSRLICDTAGHYLAKRTAKYAKEGDTALAHWLKDPKANARKLHEELYACFGNAAKAAIAAVYTEANKQSATIKQYAATMLAVLVKTMGSRTFVAAFWVGDGAIAAYADTGHVTLMSTPDNGEFAGQTRFLDAALLNQPEQIWRRIAFHVFDEPHAVLLMTDGVSDPYFETDRALRDPAHWDELWKAMQSCLKDDVPQQRLAEWLGFFSVGHHDDRTIVLLHPRGMPS